MTDKPRRYYHQRSGAKAPKLDFAALKKRVEASYIHFYERDCFQCWRA